MDLCATFLFTQVAVTLGIWTQYYALRQDKDCGRMAGLPWPAHGPRYLLMPRKHAGHISLADVRHFIRGTEHLSFWDPTIVALGGAQTCNLPFALEDLHGRVMDTCGGILLGRPEREKLA